MFFFRIAPAQHRGGGAGVPSHEHTGASSRFLPTIRTMDRPLDRPHLHSSPTMAPVPAAAAPCRARRSPTGIGDVMAFCRCYRHCTGTTRTLQSLCASAGLLAWCCMCFLALISPGGGGRDGAGDEKNESESRVGQKTTSGVIGCRKTPCGQRTCSAWSPNPNPGRGHGKHWDASGSVRGHISPVRRPVGSNTNLRTPEPPS